VNTNECNSLLPGAFPRDLLLQFYYAYDDLPSGRFAIDRPGWQVKALPLAAVVTRHDKNLGPHHFVEEAVTMVLEESIPSPESLLVQSFRLTPTEAEAYFERFASNLERMISAGRGRTHRLLGFPEIIQYDVYAEATNGMRRGNAGEPAYVEPTSADEVLRLYRHWHLIAQLDSLFRTYSPEPSHQRFAYWGDMGKLFFCANADMLDAASIEHAWMIMQS
jgi:hypothetical protein